MTTQKWLYVFMTILTLLFISNVLLVILTYHTSKEIEKHYKTYVQLTTPYYICIGAGCYEPVKIPHKEIACLIPEEEENQTPRLHYEKSRLTYDEMAEIARDVLTKLPNIKSTPEVVKLITETAIAESDGGYFMNTKGMGGLGITQVNYKTAKYLLSCLDEDDISVLNQFRDDSLSLKDNLIYNLDYNMAMCALYYYHRKSDKIYKAKSMQERAVLWKEAYNTSEGKGSPSIYVKRVRAYQE